MSVSKKQFNERQIARQVYVKQTVSDLLNTTVNDHHILTLNDAFDFIADNLLFCTKRTVERIYKREL